MKIKITQDVFLEVKQVDYPPDQKVDISIYDGQKRTGVYLTQEQADQIREALKET